MYKVIAALMLVCCGLSVFGQGIGVRSMDGYATNLTILSGTNGLVALYRADGSYSNFPAGTSITTALALAKSRDRIKLSSGVFAFSTMLVPTNWITFEGEGRDRTVLRLTDTNIAFGIAVTNGTVLRGLCVTNDKPIPTQGLIGRLGTASSISNIIVDNCWLYGKSGDVFYELNTADGDVYESVIQTTIDAFYNSTGGTKLRFHNSQYDVLGSYTNIVDDPALAYGGFFVVLSAPNNHLIFDGGVYNNYGTNYQVDAAPTTALSGFAYIIGNSIVEVNNVATGTNRIASLSPVDLLVSVGGQIISHGSDFIKYSRLSSDGFPSKISIYGSPTESLTNGTLTTLAANVTMPVGARFYNSTSNLFQTWDGAAWHYSGDTNVTSITTTDFVINQFYTNGSKVAWVQACGLVKADATHACQMALYLDQNGDGTFEQTGISLVEGINGVPTTGNVGALSAYVMPGGRFVFTNTSSVVVPAIIGGSSQWVLIPNPD